MEVSKKSISYKLFPRRLEFVDRHNKNVIFQELIVKNSKNVKTFNENQRIEYFKFLSNNIVGEKPIDFLEFGVFMGESIKIWSELNKNPKSHFFGFDTFTGLPENWNKRAPKGKFDTGGDMPKIKDKRVYFVKGIFQETLFEFLETFSSKSPLVIHLDADLYSSTLFCLCQLDRILTKGSVILFDEFYDLQNEFAAFNDYVRSHNRKFKIIARVGWKQIAFELE